MVSARLSGHRAFDLGSTESAVESRSEFVDSFRDTPEALSDEEVRQFNEGMISSGVETGEEDIDDVLYG